MDSARQERCACLDRHTHRGGIHLQQHVVREVFPNFEVLRFAGCMGIKARRCEDNPRHKGGGRFSGKNPQQLGVSIPRGGLEESSPFVQARSRGGMPQHARQRGRQPRDAPKPVYPRRGHHPLVSKKEFVTAVPGQHHASMARGRLRRPVGGKKGTIAERKTDLTDQTAQINRRGIGVALFRDMR